MASLDRAGTPELPVRTYLGAGLVIAGLGGLAVGGHAVLVSALGSQPAALTQATALTALFVGSLLVLVTVLVSPQTVSWARLGVGGALTGIGVGAFVLSVPAAWTGALGLWVVPAAGAYGAGVVVLLTAFFSAVLARSQTVDATATVSLGDTTTPHQRSRSHSGVVGDGGSDDDELEFLLDDEDDDS